ncbi:hypothetical protein BD626DRAFT_480872 [Schizophyllum amplum]|uniref:Uncharacterized protein n=1 Tax=Schizophyllum amplum TaxID=97359 RepID=A0A550CTL3_9AGAR|nr:hypothetical protein BD626DRAFT_480872 [Auriculariopsis ampla]
MDDPFAASVWDAPEPVDIFADKRSSLTVPKSPFEEDEFGMQQNGAPPDAAEDDGFGDFDDFGAPAEAGEDDDDFGDFGDADEAEANDVFDDGAGAGYGVAGPSTRADWAPLRLEPMPARTELVEDINAIIAPIWEHDDVRSCVTDQGVREAEGVNQILTSPESRNLFNTLMQAPLPTKPPNWIRSRIRRQHLITLGIPVNLDEVLPSAGGKSALPPLHISMRPMSAPPGTHYTPSNSAPGSAANSRSGTPAPGGRRTAASPFGPKPALDTDRIAELLALEADALALQPLPSLERTHSEIRGQIANTSALLTYLLQVRDSLQHDSETYNGLIAELVSEAQRARTGKNLRAPMRRSSGMT